MSMETSFTNDAYSENDHLYPSRRNLANSQQDGFFFGQRNPDQCDKQGMLDSNESLNRRKYDQSFTEKGINQENPVIYSIFYLI